MINQTEKVECVKEEGVNVESVNVEKNGNVTLINSIKENWLSWFFITISVSIISYPNMLIGYFTFFILLLLAYFSHRFSHKAHNIFTIVHHYHHTHNNLLSYFSQILLEFLVPTILMPLYFMFDTVYLNEWIILLFTLFYSSVHNINYGIFHVNEVHSSHHKFVHTNIGPDVCDVLFNTKNPKDTTVENTDHYIPNIMILTIVVLIIKYVYTTNDYNKSWINMLMYISIFVSLAFTIMVSLYLYMIYYKKNVYQMIYEIYNTKLI
jgi:hypothetical protein